MGKPIDNHIAYELKHAHGEALTARDIAELSGLSITTVNGSLRRLKAEGKVREAGTAGRARTWTVTS